jgi:alpha-methylacyl-CoA racemase
MTQPLDGIFVLDFTTLLPGPLATLMLSEAGASVMKIEHPRGEEMRAMGPFAEGESAPFALLNRGKMSLELDLKNPDDLTKLRPYLENADVLVEQFRPGVMERLGLGYEAVRAINPKIVYCSITGYGQTGPRAGEAGHDLNYIGATGLLSLGPGPADAPTVPPALIADIGGGTFPAVINILLALRQRDATGEGCHLDIAMSDGMFTFAWLGLAAGFATGRYPGASELPVTGALARYHLYPTKDDRLVACAALEQKFWLAFVAAIGLPEPFINDLRDPAAAKKAVGDIIATRTADEWRPIFAKADCCVTVVASLEEAVRDPHFVQRGLFADQIVARHGTKLPALPLPIVREFRRAEGHVDVWPHLGLTDEGRPFTFLSKPPPA